jgi:hypothetical protein
MLEWVKVIAPLLISWPVFGLIALVLFRKHILKLIEQFTNADVRKAKIGPIELERELTKLAEQGQEAVSKLNRLNELMAESRLLELEITEGGFGPIFTNEQQAKLRAQIDEFRTLTAKETPLKTEEKKLLR